MKIEANGFGRGGDFVAKTIGGDGLNLRRHD
jgi:hypothetical protein